MDDLRNNQQEREVYMVYSSSVQTCKTRLKAETSSWYQLPVLARLWDKVGLFEARINTQRCYQFISSGGVPATPLISL